MPSGAPVPVRVVVIDDLFPDPPVPNVGERVVEFRRQPPQRRASWAVETPAEVVVGFDAPAQCGGNPPGQRTIELVLPESEKPVRIQRCVPGTCSGPPRP